VVALWLHCGCTMVALWLHCRLILTLPHPHLVQAHNRDAFTSRLNSGAAFTFDLRFLNLKFEQYAYHVSESGGYANITIQRCNNNQCIHGSTQDPFLPFNYVTGDGIDTGLPPVRIPPTRFTHAEGVCPSRGNGCAST
jgi:hypothetical protein